MSCLGIVLTTTGCSLAGIGLWLGLYYRDRVSGVSTRQLFIVLLAVGFLCRVCFAFFTPTFDAPDEQSHFNYVKYLAENRSLPVQTSETDSPTNDWEYYQPPLYYLLLTPIYRLSQALFQDEAATVRAMRVFSIGLWGIIALLTMKFLKRRLNVDDDFIKIFVAGMISVLPTYTFLSSVINNDNLIMAIGAGILYCVVQPKASWKNSAAIGILLGLAMLTKLTSVVYFPLVVLFLLIGLVRKTTGWSITAHILLILAIALLLWSPLAWRNWIVYGSVTAEDVGNVVGQWESSFRAIWFALTNWQASFWAVSGIHNNISFFPSLGILVFYLALIGLLRGLFSKKEKLASFARKDINLIIASTLAVLINYLLVIRFGLLHFQGQGRFFFPLLVPLSLLMAIGLRMYSATDSEKSRIHLTGAFVTYAMSFTSFSLSMFTL